MSPVGDLPTMSASNYANNSYSGGQLLGGAQAGLLANQATQQSNLQANGEALKQLFTAMATADQDRAVERRYAVHTPPKEKPMPPRRIVQVYIADPCEEVPLSLAVLYTGKQQMTDLTDQELFFEIDIRELLDGHNVQRGQIINKKVKERTEYLEPVKVRDLKMVVVTVASF